MNIYEYKRIILKINFMSDNLFCYVNIINNIKLRTNLHLQLSNYPNPHFYLFHPAFSVFQIFHIQ